MEFNRISYDGDVLAGVTGNDRVSFVFFLEFLQVLRHLFRLHADFRVALVADDGLIRLLHSWYSFRGCGGAPPVESFGGRGESIMCGRAFTRVSAG